MLKFIIAFTIIFLAYLSFIFINVIKAEPTTKITTDITFDRYSEEIIADNIYAISFNINNDSTNKSILYHETGTNLASQVIQAQTTDDNLTFNTGYSTTFLGKKLKEDEQTWSFVNDGNGKYYIKSLSNGKYLNIKDEQTTNISVSDVAQPFSIKLTPNKQYIISTKYNGNTYYLSHGYNDSDEFYTSKSNATEFKIYKCNYIISKENSLSNYVLNNDQIINNGIYAITAETTPKTQHWKDSNYYSFSLLYHESGKKITDQLGSFITKNDFTYLKLDTAFKESAQLWKFESDNNGGYYIKSLDDDYYLNITDETKENLSVSTTPQSFKLELRNDDPSYYISTLYNDETYYIYHKENSKDKYSASKELKKSFKLYKQESIKKELSEAQTNFSGKVLGQPFQKSMGSNYYKVPSISELTDGTLIAVANANWATKSSSPNNIDTILSYSKDNGKTWNYEVINYFSDYDNNSTDMASASFSNTATVNYNNKIFMITNIFPAYCGALSNEMGTGSTGFDSNGRLLLAKVDGKQAPINKNDYLYYVDLKSNPIDLVETSKQLKVRNIKLSSNNSDSGYYIDENFDLYKKIKNIIQPVYTIQNNGNYYTNSNIFYSNCDFKVYPCSYLAKRELTVNENGISYSNLNLLNIKNHQMKNLLELPLEVDLFLIKEYYLQYMIMIIVKQKNILQLYIQMMTV